MTTTYRVITRDGNFDVEGDHYDTGETQVAGSYMSRPPLLITKKGETMAVFPHGEWKGLIILKPSSNGA